MEYGSLDIFKKNPVTEIMKEKYIITHMFKYVKESSKRCFLCLKAFIPHINTRYVLLPFNFKIMRSLKFT